VTDDLTVIVVALVGGDALARCVEAVKSQARTLLVVQRDGRVTDASGSVVGGLDRLDIPSKRRRAVELATTEWVALIEDTVIPTPSWANAVSEGLGSGRAVACGGPVRISAGLPASTRALALSEYGSFSDRKAAGETLTLPGCNFAFRRDALLNAMKGPEGLVDQIVFGKLRKECAVLWLPGMSVTYTQAYPEGARLRTRFDHGRIYGSAEAEHAGLAGRIGRAGKAFLLPLVLTLRSLRTATAAERRSLPTLGWLALQHTAWAAGEFAGALAGPSHKGLEHWR
jgi:hypothetical protein